MLDEIAGRLRGALEAKNAAREVALKTCREIIRTSACSIRAAHRLEFVEAEKLAADARKLGEDLRQALAAAPDLLYAGYVHDALKEYVEAEAVLAMLQNRPWPSPEDLGVEPAAYLNGLAEAGSEGRRYVLDRLRDGNLEEGDRVLAAMDDIYHELITFDFPDAITGGLRRTTDAFRAVLERTRGDLTLTWRQMSLERALRAAEKAGND